MTRPSKMLSVTRCRRGTVALIVLAAYLLPLAEIVLAAPILGNIIAQPSSLPGGMTTSVVVTVPITGGIPLANGVNLLQLDAAGRTVRTLGIMRDDGTGGDAKQGDGVFTFVASIAPPQSGSVYLQATAAFAGTILRVRSPILTIPVVTGSPTARPGGPYSGNVDQTINFDGSQSSAPNGRTISSYAWSFGDGSKGTGATPSHAYITADTFQASLTVTDSAGVTHTASTTASVAALPVSRPGGPYPGTVNQPVGFDGSGSTAPAGQSISSYAWSFGDNSTGSGATPTHTYTSTGNFHVSLTVTGSSGGTHAATTTAIISPVDSPVIAGFSPSSGPIGTLVTVSLSNFTPASAPQVNLVRAGGSTIAAPVSLYSVNSLSFVVPAGASTGTIAVLTGGQTVASSSPFSVTTSSSFTMSMGPDTGRLIPGEEVSYAVTMSSANGFKGLATLSVTGVPSGVTASFKPTAMTAGQTAVLLLKAPPNQSAGNSSLSVTASATIDGQAVSQSASAALQVIAATTSFVGVYRR